MKAKLMCADNNGGGEARGVAVISKTQLDADVTAAERQSAAAPPHGAVLPAAGGGGCGGAAYPLKHVAVVASA